MKIGLEPSLETEGSLSFRNTIEKVEFTYSNEIITETVPEQ